LLLVSATLWIALPVLAAEHAPPAPTALYVGINDVGPDPLPEPPGSILKLAIYASGCRNPVTIEGRLDRPERAWIYDEHIEAIEQDGPPPLPSQASVVLVGTPLRTADVMTGTLTEGLGEKSILGETPVRGFATVENPILGRRVTVHNYLSRVVVDPQSGAHISGVFLTSREWAETRAPLLFVLKADLVFPMGFHRCYLDLPELIGREDASAYLRAINFADPLAPGQSPLGKLTGKGKGPSVSDVAAAEVSVSIAAHVAITSSIGSGGNQIPSGLRYECHTFFNNKLPPNIEPNMFTNHGTAPSTYREQTNPNCAGEPVFEIPGVATEITRRIFFAGILGALAATLIIEALFIGETAPAQPRRKHRKRQVYHPL
jgi:hypothetical protein